MSTSAAGRIGATKRWAGHVPTSAEFGDLSPQQRKLIHAAIAAQREQAARVKAAA